MKTKLKRNKGITLISLIVTIIVLLILAGVAISMLSGENGILNQATRAKTRTESKTIEEQVKLAVSDALMRGNDLTKIESTTDLKDALKSQGLDVEVTGDATTGYKVETEKVTYEVSANGKVQDVYIGYYADIDGDGNPDGVIYADLAVSASGEWEDSDGAFSYEAITGTKEYYVSKTDYKGAFGTKDVLTATGTGADRFYVMALEDFNGGAEYHWYGAAWNNGNGIENFETLTSGDFGTGKKNTTTMIEKWNNSEYGEQNAEDTADIWGAIQNKVKEGWFVASIGEWSAFGYNLGISDGNYTDKGLNYRSAYFSSTMKTNTMVHIFCPGYPQNDYEDLDFADILRLSITF